MTTILMLTKGYMNQRANTFKGFRVKTWVKMAIKKNPRARAVTLQFKQGEYQKDLQLSALQKHSNFSKCAFILMMDSELSKYK